MENPEWLAGLKVGDTAMLRTSFRSYHCSVERIDDDRIWIIVEPSPCFVVQVNRLTGRCDKTGNEIYRATDTGEAAA